MDRDLLETVFWRSLRVLDIHRHSAAPGVIDRMLDAADAYATTTGGLIAEQRVADMQAREAFLAAENLYGDTPQQRAARRRALDRALDTASRGTR